MLHIFANAQLAAYPFGPSCPGLVKPVFARYVIAYQFVTQESSDSERKTCGLVVTVVHAQCSKISLELVTLCTIEIDAEALGIL